MVAEALTTILKDKNNPTIAYEDLEDYMLRILQGADYLPESFEKLMKCFKVLDKKNVGYLKIEPFKQMIKKSQLKYSDKEIQNMLEFLPMDKS